MADTDLLRHKKVLIVDDETDVLEVLEEILTMCDLRRASSFEEAKALLESEPFDLAVLDIMGVNGCRLLEIARRRNITAVMLTAHALSPEHLARSVKGGAASYLPKEEMARLPAFLEEVLRAQTEARDPWEPWWEGLPSSYFAKRWGAAWQDQDRAFWESFKRRVQKKDT